MQKQGISISRDVSIAAAQYVKEKRYWLQKLSGELIKSYFPYDRGKSGDPPAAGKNLVTTCFTGERFSRLMQLSRGSDYSLHIIAVAVVVVLLTRYNYKDNNDIIVGAPIKKQAIDSEIKFVNTVLALRVHPEGNMTLKELLVGVRETVLEADENKNYPLEVLMSMLDMPMAGDDFPLFDAAVLLENIHDIEYLSPVKINMIFCLRKTAESLELDIRYNTGRYERETVERIAAHFDLVLQRMLANVDLPLSGVDMTTEEEKKRLLEDFNDTAVEYPRDKTVCRLFDKQVEEKPDHIAVVGMGHEAGGMVYISYRELAEKGGRVAYRLKERGAGPDSIAAIMAAPAVEIIIGLMGILKAGGAFLPIDIKYPRERIDYILKDSGAAILLTAGEISGICKGMAGCAPPGPPGAGTGQCPEPADLAYVIYTSGSTGRPKGVMIRHRSLVNLIWWYKNYYSLVPTDRMSKYTAFGFDATIMEIFPGLITGIPVYVLEDDVKLDIGKLNRYFETHHITVCHLPTPVVEQFMALDNRSLRVLLAGGDKLNHYRRRGYRLENNYGPTEGTVVSTVFRVERDSLNIPIGKPISNMNAYILDRYGRLQPVGVPGELCVGGDGLARGYLNRPELTAEKFRRIVISHLSFVISSSESVTNDQCPMTNDRLYRTGDLARWLPDGNIEFLGRIDSQVKLRGYRIELGEIEACLAKHPKVEEAVVLARVSETGNRFLCAYVTVTLAGGFDNPSAMSGEFKSYLSRLLPGYMIPAHFVALEKIPLTSNGKVDRAALPAPVFQASADYIMPGTLREKTVARIWKDVLGVEDVGIDDNFFELGGNSLNIIQLGAALQEALQIDLPTVVLFQFTTIRSFLEYLRRQKTGNRTAAQESEEEKTRAEALERGKRTMKRSIDRLRRGG